MIAKKVFEIQEFKRNQDPKNALGIGISDPDTAWNIFIKGLVKLEKSVENAGNSVLVYHSKKEPEEGAYSVNLEINKEDPYFNQSSVTDWIFGYQFIPRSDDPNEETGWFLRDTEVEHEQYWVKYTDDVNEAILAIFEFQKEESASAIITNTDAEITQLQNYSQVLKSLINDI